MRNKIKRNATEEQALAIRKKLQAYNRKHFETTDMETVVITRETDTGELVGGLVVELFGNWMELLYFWIGEEHRSQGVGTSLLNEAMELGFREGAQEVYTTTMSFQALPFYKKHGFQVVWEQRNYPITSSRYFLTRDLEGWKPGRKRWVPVHVRPLEDKDVQAVAQVSIDVWKSTYDGILPTAYLKNLNVESRKRLALDVLEDQSGQTHLVVAETPDGDVAGFARGNVIRDGKRQLVELGAIYILEAYQRGGVGTRLMVSLANYFVEHGLNEMIVWVLDESPSCTFYEALGARKGSEKYLTVFGKQLKEVAYHWEDLRGLAALLEV